MNQPQMIVVIAVLMVPLWVRLRKGMVDGLVYAVILLTSATPLLRIETPGGFAELTLHRLIIITLLIYWLRSPDRRPVRSIPLAGRVGLWAGLALISLAGAVDPMSGLKRYLEVVSESFLFYAILATTLRSTDDVIRLLRAAVIGILLVASMVFVEKYAGVNVVDRFVAVDTEHFSRDIRATYRHRILLGAGMAMGWPMALAMGRFCTSRRCHVLTWLAVAVLLTSCYFSMSRGPWLAAIVAAIALGFFGSGRERRFLLALVVLAAVVLVARPGITETLSRMVSNTMDIDSFKGGTYQYRLELWRVAFEKVSRDPWRLAFGYGPAAGLNQTIDWSLSYRDRVYPITSWDNDFAYGMFQYGVVGLGAMLYLYGGVAWRLLMAARRCAVADRGFYTCLLGGALAYCFMLTNVHIFACQLNYLFWTLVALGCSNLCQRVSTDAHATESVSTPK